jgi:three-Cys-motif partner protein
LEALKRDYPSLAGKIDIKNGDANIEIKRLCAGDWSDSRSVMFLDPYGMQVEWSTIEAIAGTCAIDLWLLFPLGMAVNRVLTRSGDIPESWRKRLDLLLGDQTWFDDFYHVEPVQDLFCSVNEHVS